MMMNQKKTSNIPYVFFGTGRIARFVLEELHAAGLTPALVVTAPDAPQGRGLQMTASPVAELAAEYGIETLKPARLDTEFISKLQATSYQLFIVADYGSIIPKTILDIPARGTLNMHPSLLPRLRGPSPIRSAILNDERTTGATIIVLDEEMDHGPIVAQKKIDVPPPAGGWPPRASELEEVLARGGGKLLADVMPHWVQGDIEAQEQNHDIATYTRKFTKQDGELDLSADPYQNLLKIRAFEGWPGTYSFFEQNGKKIRVKILDADVTNGALHIHRVIPEGKREMSWEEFDRSAHIQ